MFYIHLILRGWFYRCPQVIASALILLCLLEWAGLNKLARAQLGRSSPLPIVFTALSRSEVSETLPFPVENNYTLGIGDLLQIEILRLPEYSQTYQVLSDGTLTLPLVGTVTVEGLTLDQARQAITSLYARFIRQPAITVILLDARPLRVAIAGEIQRPGSYTIAPEDNQAAEITITQAIRLAGGITQLANIRQIQITRPHPTQVNLQTVFDIDLWELLASGDLSRDIQLRDGDRIFIPTVVEIDPTEASALASATFSPDSMTVYVVGEVNDPGAVSVQPNSPLNQAILAAGGFNNRASQESVELIRFNPNGTVTRREIEIDLAQSIGNEQNPVLHNLDTVVVRRSGLTRTTDFLDTVLSPILGILNILDF